MSDTGNTDGVWRIEYPNDDPPLWLRDEPCAAWEEELGWTIRHFGVDA